jgi:DNA primase
MIPQEAIDNLLHKVNLVDVISPHVALKQAGANFTGLCPFHQEKSPSFTVNQAKQFYHCFGCAAHGNALKFLIEQGGMNFLEAFDHLATQYGDPTSEHYKKPHTSEMEAQEGDHFSLHRKAQSYFKKGLDQSSNAFEYLIDRGLSCETIEKFNIGYAPNEWQGLVGALPNSDIAKAVAAGLIVRTDTQRHFDRFRDRIMFPIMDKRNQIIAFGGRIITPRPGSPKYLNSPETALFKKGNLFYGLPQATHSIRSLDKVIVVEGYMDVVILSQNNVENVVATLGTALTIQHVSQLKQIAQKVILCFDGDSAGQNAAIKAMHTFLPELNDNNQICFAFLPENEDPDSFIQKNGRSEFISIINNAQPLSDFLIKGLKKQHHYDSAEEIATFLHEAKKLIGKISQAPTLAALLTAKAEEIAGVKRSYSLNDVSDECLISELSTRFPGLSGELQARVARIINQ